MIHFKLNGKKLSIPSSWDDVTFEHYLIILQNGATLTDALAMFTGIDRETLEKATIIGLDKVIEALAFLHRIPAMPAYTDKVGKYSLPSTNDGKFDIQFESLAQFEDMRAVIKGIPLKDGKYDPIDLTKAYGQFVSIYLQKIRDGEYSYTAAKDMLEDVYKMPAIQVITAGSFFFLKLLTLTTGTAVSFRPTTPSRKKSKQGSTSSPKRSEPTARLPRRRSR